MSSPFLYPLSMKSTTRKPAECSKLVLRRKRLPRRAYLEAAFELSFAGCMAIKQAERDEQNQKMDQRNRVVNILIGMIMNEAFDTDMPVPRNPLPVLLGLEGRPGVQGWLLETANTWKKISGMKLGWLEMALRAAEWVILSSPFEENRRAGAPQKDRGILKWPSCLSKTQRGVQGFSDGCCCLVLSPGALSEM